jgi:hypothetical protein
MSKKSGFLIKGLLIALVISLSMLVIPLTSAAAEGLPEESNPPTEKDYSRLERAWARGLALYERQGVLLERAEGIVERIENLIERAQAHGWDTSRVESALADFEAALREAHAIHQQGQGIVNSHKGFDSNGQVTDPEKALESVKSLFENLKEFRNVIKDAYRNLFEVVRAFIQAYHPANERAPRTTEMPVR